jgi:hypothetical protein
MAFVMMMMTDDIGADDDHDYEGLGKILDLWTNFYRNGTLLREHQAVGGGLDPHHHLVMIKSPYVDLCALRFPAVCKLRGVHR